MSVLACFLRNNFFYKMYLFEEQTIRHEYLYRGKKMCVYNEQHLNQRVALNFRFTMTISISEIVVKGPA
jgi:hypothetical protein